MTTLSRLVRGAMQRVQEIHTMRLVLSETIVQRDPPAFELPGDMACSVYVHGDYSNVTLIGITPAQLHDAIGCTKSDAFVVVRKPDGIWLHVNGTPHQAVIRLDLGHGPIVMKAIQEAMSRQEGQPCADCDSGAEDIPPHDCTKYAKEPR